VARIETGDVVPRVDTLARLLTVCGVALAVEPRPRESVDRAEIRALLRLTPRQRLLNLPRRADSPFQPVRAIEILTGRHVHFVLTGGIAARLHGTPVIPGVVEIAIEPERLNLERLARALDLFRHSVGLRDLRGRRQLRTRFGTIGCWWPSGETYRRLEGAATELQLARRPVLVASIDDVIEGWRGRGEELELLGAVREEMDLKTLRRVQQRRAARRHTSRSQ
jgi:hypothetical protein